MGRWRAGQQAAGAAEAALDQQRARRALAAVLAGMPDELREAFVLFEIEELTAPEAAAALGIPVGTIASRVRRARDFVRAHMARREERRERPRQMARRRRERRGAAAARGRARRAPRSGVARADAGRARDSGPAPGDGGGGGAQRPARPDGCCRW